MVGTSKSLRLLQLMELLSSRPGISMDDLARELQLSKRTVYRYLDTLGTDLRVPLYWRDGGYHLNGKAFLGPLNFTPEELFVAALSLSSSPTAMSQPFAEQAKSALRKIELAVNSGAVDKIRPWLDHSMVKPIPRCADEQPDIMEKLLASTVIGKRLFISYYSAQSKREKEIIFDPYALAFRRHAWYAAGYSREHKRVIQLKLVRIRSAEETGEFFRIPADFQADEYYSNSWEVWSGEAETDIRVRFSANVAQTIRETHRHPSQQIEEQPDGSVIFSVRVAGIREISFWILGWGAEAEVLQPPELRMRIARIAEQLSQLYSKSIMKDSGI